MVLVGVFANPLLSPSGDPHPISGCSDQSLQQAANFLITLPINSAKFVRCEVWPYMGAFSMIWIPPDPLDHPIHLITHRFLAKLVFRTWPFRHCFIFTWLCTTYILDAVLHVTGYWRYLNTHRKFSSILYTFVLHLLGYNSNIVFRWQSNSPSLFFFWWLLSFNFAVFCPLHWTFHKG